MTLAYAVSWTQRTESPSLLSSVSTTASVSSYEIFKAYASVFIYSLADQKPVSKPTLKLMPWLYRPTGNAVKPLELVPLAFPLQPLADLRTTLIESSLGKAVLIDHNSSPVGIDHPSGQIPRFILESSLSLSI